MSDGHVYAVASGKGGVGKTTTAVNLGAAIAGAGRSVVVVDVDLGMANLDDFLDVEPADATLHDVLAGEAAIEDAITEAPGGFDVVLGSPEIEAFGRADPAALRTVLPDLRDRYDIVLLDGGGGLSHDMTVPLGLADEVILVTTPAEGAVTNAEKTMTLVDRLQTDVAGLIITRIGGAGSATPETVGDRLGLSILGSVPEDGAIQMSAHKGQPLVTIDRSTPAAQSYREIAYGLVDEPLPRDWAEGSADPMEQAMASGTEGDEPDSSAADGSAETEEPAETSADESEAGIADRLEDMEDRTESAEGTADSELSEEPDSEVEKGTRAEPGAGTAPSRGNKPAGEAEPDMSVELDRGEDADAEEESRSIFARVFGGLFG